MSKEESIKEIEQLSDEELAKVYLGLVLNSDFPVEELEESKLQREFIYLLTKDQDKYSNTGLSVVRQYHPSIWHCNINGCKTPYEAWQDPEIMYKIILNRIKYIGRDLTLSKISRGLSVTKRAPKVSIFRPCMAKYLINKYLKEFETIFDPCAGFSGRLLGAMSLNKKYIGQDINSITVKESNNLIKDFNFKAEVSVKDSLYDKGEYECLFTCPPYYDEYKPKEIWHQDIEPVKNTDEWITTCLKNYKCKKYLFIIDKTELYKNYIVEELSNKSHFSNAKEKVILITEAQKELLI